MKVTYNWLKEFVDIKIPARELADKLTMAGLEVTSLEERGKDYVFEIEITSNRPDWLSVIGIAREVAAITATKLKALYPTSRQARPKLPASNFKLITNIKIQDPIDCPLYTAKIIKDVKVGPSPQWLKERLELIGCRSINNIVDITNYILFECGEPLHAFDLDKLRGDIVVRRAKPNEKIITIDLNERSLNSDILVIADDSGPVAAAGVMGGKDTEVNAETKSVFLEAALFNPTVIRRSRQKLGLQSESSYRFERGVSYDVVDLASLRAVELIKEIAQGQCVMHHKKGAAVEKQKGVVLKSSGVHQVLGIKISESAIKTILTSLGFQVKRKNSSTLMVSVPLYRPDVNSAIDLIEEIARIFDYAKIPLTLPKVTPELTGSYQKGLVPLIKQILLSLGLSEVVTYSLTDKASLMLFDQKEEEVIQVMNPLSREQEVLRTTFYPALCRCIATNLNRQEEKIAIFEIANLFIDNGRQPQEELALGLALCGERNMLLKQGMVIDHFDLLHLKGILEALFERLNIQGYYFKHSPTQEITAYVNDIQVGSIIKAQREILEAFNIKNKDVFLAQVYLEKIFSLANLNKKFSALPKYPGINRDVSFVIQEDVPVQDILCAVKNIGGQLLSEVKVRDVYKGKQIPKGHKGLTIACSYRMDERTLTEEEVNPLHGAVQNMLLERFKAQLR